MLWWVRGSVARKRKPGRVNTTPEAMLSPAEPMVWTMLFSRMVEPPNFLRTEMERTATGMDAETVSPAFNARYTVEAPKSRPKKAPTMIALGVNSAIVVRSGTYGLNSAAASTTAGSTAMRGCLLLGPGAAFRQGAPPTCQGFRV